MKRLFIMALLLTFLMGCAETFEVLDVLYPDDEFTIKCTVYNIGQIVDDKQCFQVDGKYKWVDSWRVK